MHSLYSVAVTQSAQSIQLRMMRVGVRICRTQMHRRNAERQV